MSRQPPLLRATDSQVTTDDLRATENALAISIPGDIETSADEIMARAESPAIRQQALRWKMEAIPAYYQTLLQADPLDKMKADVLAYTSGERLATLATINAQGRAVLADIDRQRDVTMKFADDMRIQTVADVERLRRQTLIDVEGLVNRLILKVALIVLALLVVAAMLTVLVFKTVVIRRPVASVR